MIRKANFSDIDDILKLLDLVHDVHVNIREDIFIKGITKYNKDELKVIINDPKRPIYVYVTDNKLIGYIFLIIEEETNASLVKRTEVYVDDLCVALEYQHQGIATILMDYAYDFAKSINAYAITLNVWNGNDQAYLLYEKLGYKPRKTTMEKIIK